MLVTGDFFNGGHKKSAHVSGHNTIVSKYLPRSNSQKHHHTEK